MMLNTVSNMLRARVTALPALCCAILVCTLAFTSGAYAQTPPAGTPGSAANVEIDANFFSGVTFTGAAFLSGNDWSQGPTGSALLLQSGGVSVLGLNNATNSLWFRDPNWGTGNDGTQYTGGQKNDQAIDSASTHWGVVDSTFGGGSPQKNDITNCYISTQVDGATGHRWVVAGFETRATNGVSFAGLELDQKGMFVDRRVPGSNKITGRASGTGAVGGRIAGVVDINNHLVGGDILLIVDYTNGGSKPVVSVREWSTNSGGSWVLIADSLTAGKGFVTTNAANIPAVAPGQGVSPQGNLTDTTIALQFVEFGLDLTGLNLLPIDPCNPLATALFQTRSSASFTSSLMDFALGKFAVIPPPEAHAGPDQAVCQTTDPTTFTLAGSATNGTPLWSVLSGRVAITDPTSLTTTITDTGTGTAVLLLTVTSGQGCGASLDTVVFNVNPNPTVSVNSPEACSGSSATLTATPSGGTGAVTFSWSTGATTSTISTSTAGTYSVTVTDTKGCTGSSTGTLTVNPNPTVSVNSPEACSGTSATLTATPSGAHAAGATFLWSTGATTSTISTSTAGTYSVTVTDTKGCTGSGSGTFTANPNPTVSVNSPEACAGFAATLTATPSGGTGAKTFAWSSGETTSTISTSTAGTYSVTVTDTKGCTGSSTGTLTANPNPTVSVDNSSACQGGAATLTATPSGGTGSKTFAWSTGATTSTISTSTAGTYSVTVTDTKGCTGTGSGTVGINPGLTVSVNSPEVCANTLPATLTATPSGGTPNYSFSWSTGATTSTISSSTAGCYSVTVTDSKGCSGTGSGCLTINPNPTVSVNSPEVCASTLPATLTATPSFGAAPSAFGAAGVASTFLWSTGATTSTISTSTAGCYSVTVTDTKGCTGSSFGCLTVNPNPTVSVNSPEVCASTLPATLTGTPSGGTGAKTFAWSTGATTSTISTSTAGTYSVTVTDTKGCTGSSTGTLTVNPNPTVSVNSPEVCASTLPATLTATPSGGTGASTFAWSTGATTSTIGTSTAGCYSVTVTDTKGCTGSSSGCLTVNPNPTVSVNSALVCPGDSATLTATASGGTGSVTYAWSSGATASTIRTSTAGTYSVTVTDTKGCTGSGSGTITLKTDCGGHIFPTQTTCSEFASGTATRLPSLCYKPANGTVGTATPGVFFYFAQITAPSASFCVDVTQTKACSTFKLNRIQNGNQIYIYSDACQSLTQGTEPSPGQGRVCITNATPGNHYIISVKYSVKSIQGGTYSGAPPTCQYNFITSVAGTPIQTTADSINAAPNCVGLSALGKTEFKGASELSLATPAQYALHTNYPNPFNPTTQIKFDLPEASSVRLSVFNILGQEVATLVDGVMDAGYQSVDWSTANPEGAALPSGIYMYRLQATSMTSGKEFHDVMKMVLMK